VIVYRFMDNLDANTLAILGVVDLGDPNKVLAGTRDQVLEKILGPLAQAKEKSLAESTAREAAELLVEARIQASAPAPRITYPLLQAASVEEDANLHRQFATLLANASDPLNLRKVSPSFVSILKDLSPEEALVLETLYTHTTASMDMIIGILRVPKMPDGSSLEVPAPYGSFEALTDNLQRLGLVQMSFGGPTRSGASVMNKIYGNGIPLTPLGRLFMAAVSKPPKDRSKA
jgi:hypothetical protein